MSDSRRSFTAVQREHFRDAAVEQYRWTTEAPGFAETEDALLAPIASALEPPCLEIGCGEGNNLARLLRRASFTAIDRFHDKLVFAAERHAGARLATADAHRLPFVDGCFRTVFIRDLLHHTEDPTRVLDEAVRVLAPGGMLHLIEPNARNPIVCLQTHLVAAERGARRSTPRYVEQLLGDQPLDVTSLQTQVPLPLRRMLLHYRFGFPALGRNALTRSLLATVENGLGRLLPRSRWSYVVACARRS